MINEGNHPDHNLLLQHVESHDDITRNNSENGILGDPTSKSSEFAALKENVSEMEKIRSVGKLEVFHNQLVRHFSVKPSNSIELS